MLASTWEELDGELQGLLTGVDLASLQIIAHIPGDTDKRPDFSYHRESLHYVTAAIANAKKKTDPIVAQKPSASLNIYHVPDIGKRFLSGCRPRGRVIQHPIIEEEQYGCHQLPLGCV